MSENEIEAALDAFWRVRDETQDNEKAMAAALDAVREDESRNRLLELRQKTVQLLEAIDAGLEDRCGAGQPDERETVAMAVAGNDGYTDPQERHYEQADVILQALRDRVARRNFRRLDEKAAALEQTCPACGHEWKRHDPEDGRCDAHSAEPGVFGPCRCGRDVAFTAEANVRLSHAALAARSPQEDHERRPTGIGEPYFPERDPSGSAAQNQEGQMRDALQAARDYIADYSPQDDAGFYDDVVQERLDEMDRALARSPQDEDHER